MENIVKEFMKLDTAEQAMVIARLAKVMYDGIVMNDVNEADTGLTMEEIMDLQKENYQ